MADSSLIINNLPTISFIAGTEQELTFYIYDSGSAVKNLSSATCTWEMARYGTNTTALTKTAIVSGSPVNKMVVTLDSFDTELLSGKFIHQPVITEGSSEYRPSQGIINIFAQIS
jgi:hypothetical protein